MKQQLLQLLALLILVLGGCGMVLPMRYRFMTGGSLYSVQEVAGSTRHDPLAWVDRIVLVRGEALPLDLAPLDRDPGRHTFLLLDPTMDAYSSSAVAPSLLVEYGPEDRLLSLLRGLPMLGTAAPAPQQPVYNGVALYRVQLRRQAGTCRPAPCLAPVLLDASPVGTAG